MTLLLGCLLGLGVLLVASPLLWPRGRRRFRLGATAVPSEADRPGEGLEETGARHPGTHSRLLGHVRERMTQAGLGRVSLATFTIVSLVLGLAAAATTLAITPVAALAAATGAAALATPLVVVSWRAARRRRVNRDLWPDAVDHLVSALRSGLALPECVATLAHTGPAATREAFAEFEQDYRATAHFDRCLDRLKDRLADPVADRILETLRMSREVGGSELPTVLRGLAAYLRQSVALRGEVEARQSWVRNAARLGAAAPWVVLLLLSTRPEAAIAYNSPVGVLLIGVGFAVTVLAYRLMISLARLPEERRWFR